MDDAKGFLSMWKDDYGNKNKEILERAKNRRKDAEKEKEEIKALLDEVSQDLDGSAKDLVESIKINADGFLNAVKEGSKDVSEKLELEKRMKQLNDFLIATKNQSSEKFKQISAEISDKIKGMEAETEQEKEKNAENADSFLKRKSDALKDDLKKTHADIKKLFSDDDDNKKK